MKGYGVKDLAARYGLKDAGEAANLLKGHLEELNAQGEHARFSKGAWRLDETALPQLDELVGYKPKEDKTKKDLRGAKKDLEASKKEIQALKAESEKLKKQLEKAKADAAQEQAEVKKLRESLLSLQESQGQANAVVVRRAEERTEQAEQNLLRAKERYQAQEEMAQKRTKELEDKNRELLEQLDEMQNMLERRTQANFEVLQVKKSEAKLLKDIQEKDREHTQLVAAMGRVEEERNNLSHTIEDQKAQAVLALHTLNDLQNRIQRIADIKVPAKAQVVAPVVKTEEKTPAQPPAPTPFTGSLAQDIEREKRLQQLKEKQEGKQGRVRALFSRVASFF